MTNPRAARCFAVVLCLFATSAFAQQYTIKNIVFDGKVPYPQTSLEAASGLKPGQVITQKDLEQASQRLSDTGAFDDLQATLDGPTRSITVLFKVKPADPAHVLTASFQNFVWWQPAELAAEIQKRVPLFNGTIPEAGNQQDAVLDALKQLLASKQIAATLTDEPVAPSLTQPLRLLEYRIQSPTMRIHSLTTTGVSAPFAPGVEKTVHALTGARLNEGLTPANLSTRLLSVYRDAGYQEASVTLTRTLAASSPDAIDVDVAATITEGPIDHLAKLDWPGSPLMSAQEFAAAATLHPGDVVTQKEFLKTLGNLEAAYHNKGYMDVALTATPRIDAATHQIAYTLSAMPGTQYTLHQVTALNLTDAQRKDFDRGWLLHSGDIYNEGYVVGFLKNNTALQTLNGYTASFKTVADPDTHAVDLTMTFARASRSTN